MTGNDFLVVYEGEEGDDEVVLDVDVHEHERRHNIEAEFGAVVTNRAGTAAIVGLVLTFVGAVLSLGTAALFMINYPGSWYPKETADEGLIRMITALGLVGALLLVLGNLLVGFGRQLHAEGILHSLRFVPEE